MEGKRKFFLAAYASFVASSALFCGYLRGSEWIEAQALVLGLYKAANIIDKKLGGAG